MIQTKKEVYTKMNTIFLHKDDLQTIMQFVQAFPDTDTVEIKSDSSSGIGNIITATLHHVDLNGMLVSVTKNIVDETSW